MTQEFVTLRREVVEQALEALNLAYEGKCRLDTIPNATDALRAALEQPQGEREPVGKLISDPYEGHIFIPYGDRWPFNEDLYTHPQPQRQPLTDEQWLKLWTGKTGQRLKPGPDRDRLLRRFRFAERAHNIK